MLVLRGLNSIRRRWYTISGVSTKVMGLPTKEKGMAFKLLKTMGVKAPSIPTNKVQMVAKIIKALGKGIDKAKGTGDDMGY